MRLSLSAMIFDRSRVVMSVMKIESGHCSFCSIADFPELVSATITTLTGCSPSNTAVHTQTFKKSRIGSTASKLISFRLGRERNYQKSGLPLFAIFSKNFCELFFKICNLGLAGALHSISERIQRIPFGASPRPESETNPRPTLCQAQKIAQK